MVNVELKHFQRRKVSIPFLTVEDGKLNFLCVNIFIVYTLLTKDNLKTHSIQMSQS